MMRHFRYPVIVIVIAIGVLATSAGAAPALPQDDPQENELRRRVADGDPIAQRMHAEQRWDVIPNGEPVAAFEGRVRRGIERIAAAHQNELVVAVVHGGVIGQVLNIASGGSGFSFLGADNASISHVVIEPQRWVVRCFNDTSHLSPTFSAAAEPMT